jgi:hypothetical protein
MSNAGAAAATANDDYCRDYLPPSVLEQLQAGAFRSLMAHLQERSDQVSNMALMTTAGFCRNCIAKVSTIKNTTILHDG